MLNSNLHAQTYFDDLIQIHMHYFYHIDSALNNSDIEIPVFQDSLILINENKETKKRYWLIDSSGQLLNIYIEISKDQMLVITNIHKKNKNYSLYKKRGKKKAILIEWIDYGFEKRKKKLFKPNSKKITYFKDGLVF